MKFLDSLMVASRRCVLLAIALISLSASADEAALRQKVQAFLKQGGTIQSVTKLPVGELNEIVLSNGQILYTDDAFTYFFVGGELISTADKRNITDETNERLSKIDFQALPFGRALKRVNGNGQRVIATFEDPNCGYCKKLRAELDALPDATIYTFVIAVINEDSIGKAKRLWCADDRNAAWALWMKEGKLPAERKCDDVIDENQKLGAQVRISGTPTIFFENGKRITGFVTKDKIEAAINAAIGERAAEAVSKAGK